MKKITFFASAMVLALAACDETTTTAKSAAAPASATVDPLTAALSGKTLLANGHKFVVGKNGSLTGRLEDGTKFVGSWNVQNGKWCNVFSEPAGFDKPVCQKATLGDGTVTIVGRNGGPTKWNIQ